MGTILHSDANCFYASVEMVEHPELRGKPIAVCGSTENRHGIVLTASYPAKRKGVKTGEAIWQAKQKCPEMIVVDPHYDLYLKYSKILRRIYLRHSDNVESFGMDECWVGLPWDMKQGIETAEEIRRQVRDETGLTVSVGVSFTKALAKLGSDMKKPDAMTVLGRDDFREKCWGLPVSDLLYVGPQTTKKLRGYNIQTIGDLARADLNFIQRRFGKNGCMVWSFANGLDQAQVAPKEYKPEIKSAGHGSTCIEDLQDNYSVWLVIYELAQDVSHRMISSGFCASSVSLWVKDNQFMYHPITAKLNYPTQDPCVMAQAVYERFLIEYKWLNPVRALTVTANNLQDDSKPLQIDFFGDYQAREKKERCAKVVDEIRGRFGKDAIRAACFLGQDLKMATDKCETVKMPGMMYR